MGDGRTPEAVAEGFLTVAVENMANAIKKISVERGYDVTRYALNCFGGAGGQHACLVADALGIETILVSRYSGLLSAYGIGLSAIAASRQAAPLAPLADGAASETIATTIASLSAAVAADLAAQGVSPDRIVWRPRLLVRYEGTDTALPVDFSERDLGAALAAFETAHQAQFGFLQTGRAVVVDSVDVEGREDRPAPESSLITASEARQPEPDAHGSRSSRGGRSKRRSTGARASGPATGSPARR